MLSGNWKRARNRCGKDGADKLDNGHGDAPIGCLRRVTSAAEYAAIHDSSSRDEAGRGDREVEEHRKIFSAALERANYRSVGMAGGDGVGIVAGAGAGNEPRLVELEFDVMVLVGLLGGRGIEGDFVPRAGVEEAL